MGWLKSITVVEALILVAALVAIVIGLLNANAIRAWSAKPVATATLGDISNAIFFAVLLAGLALRK